MNTNEPTQNPCHLYRHFDKDGNLLYVGISMSVLNRIVQHERNSKWFPNLGHITIQEFGSRSLAEKAERIAIKTEKPPYNIVHKDKAKQRISKAVRRRGQEMREKYPKFYEALAVINEKIAMANLRATRQ
jgi:excinuclease UvrABC nuclease subunit